MTALTEAPTPPPAAARAPVRTTWRRGGLPASGTGSVGVPFSEGVSSVFLGAIAYIPVALFTGYAGWNYAVAAVLTVALSYALWSRRVVVGSDFVAVRKFGPYRVAPAASITSGALVNSQRGGVLKLKTSDGRTMRLRRIEFTEPAVNAGLRTLVERTGSDYDQQVHAMLELPYRPELGQHRYLLDAVQ